MGSPLVQGLHSPDQVVRHDLFAFHAADLGLAALAVDALAGLGAGIELVEFEDIADVGVARVGLSHALGVGDHLGDLFGDHLRRVGEVDGVVVGFAHLAPVKTQDLGGLSQERLGFRKEFAVEEIEASCDFAGDLHVGHLVDAHRHPVGLVHDDVRRLQNRVTQETEGG